MSFGYCRYSTITTKAASESSYRVIYLINRVKIESDRLTRFGVLNILMRI